jgi:hypothetical protein
MPYNFVRKEAAMSYERPEVRLDSEHRRKLAEVAAVYHTPLSEAVRTMIDEAYEAVLRERRREAVRRLGAMEVEDVPDPEELSRQLNSAHELPDLY